MIFSPRTPRATRALGFLVLVVAFTAGAIAATAVERVLHAEESAVGARDEADSCDKPRSHILDSIDLTDEQRGRIEAILEHRRTEADRVWSEARPALRAIMDTTRAEIRAVLTAEQREEYDRLRRERKEAARAERDRESGKESEAPR